MYFDIKDYRNPITKSEIKTNAAICSVLSSIKKIIHCVHRAPHSSVTRSFGILVVFKNYNELIISIG